MLSRIKAWLGVGAKQPRNAQTGAEGERVARQFLRDNAGFQVVAKNWRSPRDRRDEIDLICLDKKVLVFVEVKTRAAKALVSGYNAVDQAKRRVILRAGKDYLRLLNPTARPETFRFDVVEVESGGEGRDPVVRHFENVPLFPKDLQI
jgi:putative endonuclease